METPRTLVEMLRALETGARPGSVMSFIDDDGGECQIPQKSILGMARRYAATLRAAGVEKGDIVPIILPTSADFVVAFFGVLVAGGIPSALALPMGFGDLEAFGGRVRDTSRFLRSRHVITAPGLAPFVENACADGGPAVVVLADAAALVAARSSGGEELEAPELSPDDLAIIQCTSGSTDKPKAVVLTHAAVLANLEQIGLAIGIGPADVGISWLPMNHDMGLIGCLLFDIYWGFPAYFLTPMTFLRRPMAWLDAVSRYRATVTAGPNFAYSYVAARAKPAELAALDLSTWRVALCGAEPIAIDTLRAFERRFAECGFRSGVFTPCYGLAEASLAVTIHRPGLPLEVEVADRAALTRDRFVAAPVEASAPSTSIVGCGAPVPGTRVTIMGPDGTAYGEGRVGRIKVSGPSVMSRYLHDPARTAETLGDGWIDTGDLGFIRDGQLFVTGREKDVIKIRGALHTPSDFEQAAQVPGVRRGNAVAFGVFDPVQGTEIVVLVCETDLAGTAERDELRRAVIASVMAQTGVRADVVHLVGRETIPKTTSGKLQRSSMRARYLAGDAGELR